MVWQLWRGSRGMGASARFDDRLRGRAPRIVVASLLMGVALWGVALALAPMLVTPGPGAIRRWRCWSASAMVGYFGAGALLGAFRLADFHSALKRGR